MLDFVLSVGGKSAHTDLYGLGIVVRILEVLCFEKNRFKFTCSCNSATRVTIKRRSTEHSGCSPYVPRDRSPSPLPFIMAGLTRSAKSGSKWTPNDLVSYNISLNEVDPLSFFGLQVCEDSLWNDLNDFSCRRTCHNRRSIKSC